MNRKILEVDEAGQAVRQLVISPQDDVSRVDFITNNARPAFSLRTLLNVFLPAGFPHSVTSDYVEQISNLCKHVLKVACGRPNNRQDSLQAFASSIAGLLSSRAVLASLGVGNATSTATAAVVLNVLQESLGRLSTILFAHRYGTVIEPECKMYRLLADILNDCAFVLDCLSPTLPPPIRVLALASGGVLRSLCGVAAGSSKASLSAHFAKWGNLAELNAKDSSQETVISLLGMLCGTMVVTYVDGPIATWSTLILLLALHLELNRRAVRAVAMTSMNRQRAGLVYHHLLRGRVPSPREIAKEEKIFGAAAALRNAAGQRTGTCEIGVSLGQYFRAEAASTVTGSIKISQKATPALLDPFAKTPYILWYDISSLSESVNVFVALKQGATPQDQVAAWWHATAIALRMRGLRSAAERDSSESLLQQTLRETAALMAKFEPQMRSAGWNIEGSKLEVRSGVRVQVDEP